MQISPRLSLTYVLPQQAQKHLSVNETIRRLDALVQMRAISKSVAAEPPSPTEGDAYILPAGKSGAAWSGFADNAVAVFQDGAWTAISPHDGFLAWVSQEGAFYRYAGGQWSALSSGGSAATQVGVNTTADTTNRFAVKSDATLFNHDDVTPGTGDHRLKINKSASAKTASVIFQTGAAARAELGLAGNDDFRVKVSADGAAFSDALVINKDTRFIGVGHGAPDHALDVNGAIRVRGVPAGGHHLSNDGATVELANGATLDINNFSGLVFVVELSTGRLAQFLCGGGSTVLVAATGTVGTLTFAANPIRYVFTNGIGATGMFRFLLLRARDSA